MLSLRCQRAFACEFGVMRRPIVGGELAARESRVFAERESFIVGVRARRIEEKQAKRVARPAVVVQKALQAGFFDQSLFVSGGCRRCWAVGRSGAARMV